MSDEGPRELPPGALGRAPRAGDEPAGGLFGDGGAGRQPDTGSSSDALDGRPAKRTGRRTGRRRGSRPAQGECAAGTDDAREARPERSLTAEERQQHALGLAYRHLSKRDRTVSEVRAHLERRGVDEPSIVAALAELTEFAYLDDERYAARFVEDKRRLEGWGHLRIEQGLRRTGVPREIADRAVAADPHRDEEAELAVQELDRRLHGRPPADDRARQKALRLLATKGYPLDVAYAAVRAYERHCADRDDG